MMRAGFMIGLILASTGCPMDPPGDDPDAASKGAGLLLVVHADTESSAGKVRGPASATLSGSSRLELELEDVRAIGDAAPGDGRTTLARVSLVWSDDQVQCLAFDNVPPGIYSRVLARVVRYHIEGAVEESSDTIEFTIDDTPPAPLSLMVDTQDVVVDVHEDGALALEVSVAHVIDAIDWEAQVPDGEGHVYLDGTSDDIETIRNAMAELWSPGGEPDTSSCPR